jgi:hypothetical protein
MGVFRAERMEKRKHTSQKNDCGMGRCGGRRKGVQDQKPETTGKEGGEGGHAESKERR